MQILSNCTGCALCAAACPNGAVVLAAAGYRILAPLCTECVGYADEPSCQETCPEEAIASTNFV